MGLTVASFSTMVDMLLERKNSRLKQMHLPHLFHRFEEKHGCTRTILGYSDRVEQMRAEYSWHVLGGWGWGEGRRRRWTDLSWLCI